MSPTHCATNSVIAIRLLCLRCIYCVCEITLVITHKVIVYPLCTLCGMEVCIAYTCLLQIMYIVHRSILIFINREYMGIHSALLLGI